MSLGYSCVSQLGSHLEPAAPPGGIVDTSLISDSELLGGSSWEGHMKLCS